MKELFMKRIGILSVLSGLGLMQSSPMRNASPVLAHPVHAKYKLGTPKATRDRKNTESGVIKAKRASVKSANVKRNKARH